MYACPKEVSKVDHDLGFSLQNRKSQQPDPTFSAPPNARSNSLLLLPESEQTDARHLDDLESHTGDITLGLSAPSETGDQDLVVLVGLAERVQRSACMYPGRVKLRTKLRQPSLGTKANSLSENPGDTQS